MWTGADKKFSFSTNPDYLGNRNSIIIDKGIFNDFFPTPEKYKEFAQSVLKELDYRQPNFDNINYEWYKKEGFDKNLDVVCTYDSMDWTVADGSHMFEMDTGSVIETNKIELLEPVFAGSILDCWRRKGPLKLPASMRFRSLLPIYVC